jgi:hypothetical protein
MVKKKTSAKPVDRTQIYVAIIGVVGTIIVALITVLSNKPVERPTPQTVEATSAVTDTTTPAQNISTPIPQSGGLCLEDYLKNISAGSRIDLDAGISTVITTSKEGLYGIRLFDGGKLLGEMQFTGSTNSKSFQVVSMIDANCLQIFEYGNLDRPTAKGAIGNWENLGIPFDGGNYRLRMGWYSGNQISLIFSSNQ